MVANPTHSESPPTASVGVTPVTRAVQTLLFVLPLGYLVQIPVGGAAAAAGDLAVGFLVLAWTAWLLLVPGAAEPLIEGLDRDDPTAGPTRSFLLGVGCLLLFAGWVAASGWWGFHPEYCLLYTSDAADEN